MIKTFSDKEHKEGFEIFIERVEPSEKYPSGFAIRICNTYDSKYVYGKDEVSLDAFDLFAKVSFAIINYDIYEEIQNKTINEEENDNE